MTRMRTGHRRFAWFVAVACALPPATGIGCRKSVKPGASDSGATLPPLVLRDDSIGLTFSYLMLDGGFKIVTKIADVPYEVRDVVRVWTETDGITGPYVYVADLRTHKADGTYKVEVVARSVLETLAAARRKILPEKSAQVENSELPGDPKHGGVPGAHGKTVIVYGADWCKPCHQAEAYLKSKGVAFVHKDIEEAGVSEELQKKLRGAGLSGGSIPVIDVGGRLLVGFSSGEIDAALAALGK